MTEPPLWAQIVGWCFVGYGAILIADWISRKLSGDKWREDHPYDHLPSQRYVPPADRGATRLGSSSGRIAMRTGSGLTHQGSHKRKSYRIRK